MCFRKFLVVFRYEEEEAAPPTAIQIVLDGLLADIDTLEVDMRLLQAGRAVF
jgi:hypothetical protein